MVNSMSADSIANPFLGGDSLVRSLNRARIAALRGVPGGDAVLGRTGYELLSAASLHEQIASAAERLGLDPAGADLIRRLDACFDDPSARPHALAIARAYGRRLGCLLLMLRRGEEANRAARPEWSEAHWAFWRSVRQIYVGGGLVAGNLGRHAVVAARELLAEAGETDLALARAEHAAYLPLIGLARSVPPDSVEGVVLDFGQTSTKRGRSSYRAGRLCAIEVWPAAPTVCGELTETDLSDDDVRQRWDRMASAIAESWGGVPSERRAQAALGICLACYLIDGHPAPADRGCYGVLRRLGPHLASFVERDLGRRLGRAVPVALLHDGAAAAAAYAGQDRAVVITLGTAIGNGFPPPGEAARPLADDFALTTSSEIRSF